MASEKGFFGVGILWSGAFSDSVSSFLGFSSVVLVLTPVPV